MKLRTKAAVFFATLALSSLSFAHYYYTRAITNPTSTTSAPVTGTPTSPVTTTQWYCVNAAGAAVAGGPWATQALADTPCGTAVAADGVTRYLEERVTTTTNVPTTTTTTTRRFEVFGGTTLKVSDAHAGPMNLLTGGGRVDVPGEGSASPLITGLMLDDFSHGFRNSGTANPSGQTIYDYTATGTPTIVADTSASFLTRGNTHSLRDTGIVNDPTYGNRFQVYLPDSAFEGVTCWGNNRYHIWRYAENPPGTSAAAGGGCQNSGGTTGKTWTNLKYDFLRFWVKVPAGYDNNAKAGDIGMDGGQNSVEMGAFLTSNETAYESDDNNSHFYHEFPLYSCSCWQLVILDAHPQHVRSGDGNTPQGHWEVGYLTPAVIDARGAFTAAGNYWDWETGIYWDVYPAINGNHDFKAFEFYEDDAEVGAADHIATLTGWAKTTGEVYVGWNKDTTDNSGTHDVKYAWSDIHTLGWTNATAMPANATGMNDPTAWADYTQMVYHTASGSITTAGHDWIYVAIKRSGDGNTDFRQIVLPVQNGVPLVLLVPLAWRRRRAANDNAKERLAA